MQVLPFAFNDGRAFVLLGGEMVHTGPRGHFRQYMWRDFGGQREAIDVDSAATASRSVIAVFMPCVSHAPYSHAHIQCTTWLKGQKSIMMNRWLVQGVLGGNPRHPLWGLHS